MYADAAARSSCVAICIGAIICNRDVGECRRRATTVEQAATITIRAVSADGAVNDGKCAAFAVDRATFGRQTHSLVAGKCAVTDGQVTNVVDAATYIR